MPAIEIVHCTPDEAAHAAINYLRLCDEAGRKLIAGMLSIPQENNARLKLRDDLLRAICRGLPDHPVSTQAELICDRWKRYLGGNFKRNSDLSLLSDSGDLIADQLHRLCRLNKGEALSTKQIINILQGKRTSNNNRSKGH